MEQFCEDSQLLIEPISNGTFLLASPPSNEMFSIVGLRLGLGLGLDSRLGLGLGLGLGLVLGLGFRLGFRLGLS